MKKFYQVLSIILTFSLFLSLSGCEINSSKNQTDNEKDNTIKTVNTQAITLSGFEDKTDDNGLIAYLMQAPYTDNYIINCRSASAVSVYEGSTLLKTDKTGFTVKLNAGKKYIIQIETSTPNKKVSCAIVAENHKVRLPYEVIKQTSYDGMEEGKPTEINYTMREGGKYIYSNNPEFIHENALGHAFLQDTDLQGEVFFTFEHTNYTGKNIYLGYQIKNQEDHDVFVTIQNIGYQTRGVWRGEECWSDFYNTQFNLADNFYDSGELASSNYTTRIYQYTTYRLPKGEYFYAIGGTTQDAYLNYSVDSTANRSFGFACANGAVKFYVTGGKVTGTFYCYDNYLQVQKEPTPDGYVVERDGRDYSAQYIGSADHSGVIDGEFKFLITDNTKKGCLPVSYVSNYDEKVPSLTQPYTPYNSTAHYFNNVNIWFTNINPQNEHKGIGSDIVAFTVKNKDGTVVTIDNDHADGYGRTANTANWMIEYQEKYVIKNQSSNNQVIRINYKDNGTLYIIVRDINGNVLETHATRGLYSGKSSDYYYQVEIPSNSNKTVVISYVLAPCACGCVSHYVELI